MVERRSGGARVRPAREGDLTEVAAMIDDFVRGHPAETHPRQSKDLLNAYFGRAPVAQLLVAQSGERIVGMGQWNRIYDMFWDMFGGRAEWLYVKPRFRGLGISAAIVAAICDGVRESGGQFIYGQGYDHTRALYERVAIRGITSFDFYLSGQAFDRLARLSGESPREIVRRLPDPALNRVSVERD